MDDALTRSDRPSSFLLDFDELFAIEAVGVLTTLEVGVFIRLLRRAWNATPPATLPNNDRTLAQWGEVSIVQWGAMSLSVRSCFELGDDERLISRYLLAKYETAQQKRREGRERAQRARTQREPSANPSNSSSGSESEPSCKSESPTRARAKNPLWDTVANLFHGGTVPSTARSGVGKAVAALREVGATVEGIQARHAAAVAAGWTAFTPLALVKHWHTLPIGNDGEHGGPAIAHKRTSAADVEAIFADGGAP